MMMTNLSIRGRFLYQTGCQSGDQEIRGRFPDSGQSGDGSLIDAPIANKRQYGSYTFVIFPNSRQKWTGGLSLQDQIDSVGAQYWRPII